MACFAWWLRPIDLNCPATWEQSSGGNVFRFFPAHFYWGWMAEGTHKEKISVYLLLQSGAFLVSGQSLNSNSYTTTALTLVLLHHYSAYPRTRTSLHRLPSYSYTSAALTPVLVHHCIAYPRTHTTLQRLPSYSHTTASLTLELVHLCSAILVVIHLCGAILVLVHFCSAYPRTRTPQKRLPSHSCTSAELILELVRHCSDKI